MSVILYSLWFICEIFFWVGVGLGLVYFFVFSVCYVNGVRYLLLLCIFCKGLIELTKLLLSLTMDNMRNIQY